MTVKKGRGIPKKLWEKPIRKKTVGDDHDMHATQFKGKNYIVLPLDMYNYMNQIVEVFQRGPK